MEEEDVFSQYRTYSSGTLLDTPRYDDEDEDGEDPGEYKISARTEAEEKPDTSTLSSENYGVTSFGNPANARLGDHGNKDFGCPQRINGIPLHAVKQVACGEFLSVVLLANGQVWQWGNNVAIPTQQKGFNKRCIQIAAGDDHICAITEEEMKNLYSWGRNDHGQLGQGHKRTVTHPKALSTFPSKSQIVYVTCGNRFTIAITMTGNVYGWGLNDKCQLGLTNPELSHEKEVLVPTRIDSLSKEFSSGKNDPVEDILDYSRLMIDSGKEHAVSWVSTHGRFLQADQKVAFRDMTMRVSDLEHKLREANITIERLKKENKGAGVVLTAGGTDMVTRSDRSVNAQYMSIFSNSERIEVPRESVNSTSSTENVPVDYDPEEVSLYRNIKEDPQIEATDDLIAALSTRSRRLSEKRDVLKRDLENKVIDTENAKRIIQTTDESVLGLWKSVEECTLQMNQEKYQRSGGTQQKVQQLQQQMHDNEFMALSGEKSVQLEVQNLTKLEDDCTILREALTDTEYELDIDKSTLDMLKKFRLKRVSEIKRGFVETQSTLIHEWVEKSRKIFKELQQTKIDEISRELAARSYTDNDAYGKKKDGINDILRESNSRIDHILLKARSELALDHNESNSDSNDAGLEMVSVLLASICDNADVRRENNFYISHLLGHAKQQMEMFKNSKLC
mmetsp:Transcript_37574/g.61098  ORF Transcript_37574/g.61098 Transcript_37574/m.61098 type:complete len:677 (-) Transcript_37574:953-2983(-)|eukprot:CAMPEP_0203758908 /NCGR_PEP_ID=MMETSP0098-20131031/11795_1 /ASSEMBLY_ACC=CAM_ASM_000208 /TAXON_ID=96639 /ORGANISM=" , Strain NY0313808BC1" /LENGTH=676 /DNA_ID=CAMNT_0050651577 /DNA_START=478 /DNA_END=2508 /DNA_ORIENTATION=-